MFIYPRLLSAIPQFLIGTVVIVAFILSYPKEKDREAVWRPTGDGRTILNTRTGEVRMLSGETIEEYRARQESARTIEYAWSYYPPSSLEKGKRNAERLLEAQRIVLAVQDLPYDEDPEITLEWWRQCKAPFLENKLPSKEKRDEMVRLVARALNEGRLKGDKWWRLQRLLSEVEYKYDNLAEVTLTEAQVAESEALLREASHRAQLAEKRWRERQVEESRLIRERSDRWVREVLRSTR